MTAQKRRPVIVISNREYNRSTPDMLVVAMTSNPLVAPHSFLLEQEELGCGTLNRPGRVRADKIYSLAQSLAVTTFGRVDSATLDRIRERIRDLLT